LTGRIDDTAIVAYISIRRNIFHTAHIMQIINLTHAEAADPAVIRSLVTLMESASVTVAANAGTIGIDAPNVGAPVPAPAPVAHPDPVAAAHFGEAPMPAPVPDPQPVTAPALSTAGAVQSPTAPVVPPVPGAAVLPPAITAPALPPAAAVPAPSAPAAPVSPAGVEVDANGLPWDARIHASTKRKNADGTWTARRGLNDPALQQRVEAELRQTMAVPGAVVPPPAPAAVVPPPAPAAVVPPPAPAPVAPPPEAAATARGETFAQFCTRLSPNLASGAITQAQLLQAATELGLPGFPSLMQRPDLIPQFAVKVGM
jgi:hypothetical protein